jgi:hypothetical protein
LYRASLLLVFLALVGASCRAASPDSRPPDEAQSEEWRPSDEFLAARERALSLPERNEFVVDCLRREGFEAEVVGLGLSLDAPDEQEALAFAALEACQTAADNRFGEPEEPSAEDMYRFQIEVAQCLRGEGFQVPDPPSMETWVERYRRQDFEGLWFPYDSVVSAAASMKNEDWERLNLACPQEP